MKNVDVVVEEDGLLIAMLIDGSGYIGSDGRIVTSKQDAVKYKNFKSFLLFLREHFCKVRR